MIVKDLNGLFSCVFVSRCNHEWEYYEDEDGRPYTGYLERCKKCKKIIQIPQ